MKNETVLILADGVVAMTGEEGFVAQRGGVAVRDGVIVGAGAVEELRSQFGGVREEYVAGVMVPGLINAHTHLELGEYQHGGGGEKHSIFPREWVGALMRNYPAAERVEEIVREAVRAGAAESLRSGVTMVGDISRHCAWTRAELAGGPLRVVSFGEVIGLGKMRERAGGAFAGGGGSGFGECAVARGALATCAVHGGGGDAAAGGGGGCAGGEVAGDDAFVGAGGGAGVVAGFFGTAFGVGSFAESLG